MTSTLLLLLALSQSPTVVFKTSNQTNDQLTYADVSELGVEVGASGIYAIQWFLTLSSAAATTGIQLAVNGPATPDVFAATITCFTGVSTPGVINTTTYDSGLDLADSAGASKVNCTIAICFVNGANSGTVNARVRSEVEGSAITVFKGSRVVAYGPYTPP